MLEGFKRPECLGAWLDMKTILVNDKMQTDYSYDLVAPMGKKFSAIFEPQLTPKEMLALGVFGGKYMNDCRVEFPSD